LNQHTSDVPAAPGATSSTRAAFLSRSLLAGGAVAGGALLAAAPRAASAPSAAGDARILNFLLRLEHLEADFYAAAVAQGELEGEVRRFAETAGRHERAHVALLRRVLGRRARAKPTYEFGDRTGAAKFAGTAVMLEELVLAAHNGQGANLTNRALLPSMRISSVDARHAAWIRDVVGEAAAPRAADPGLSAEDVTATLRSEGLLPR
jgi:hypothetical protein